MRINWMAFLAMAIIAVAAGLYNAHAEITISQELPHEMLIGKEYTVRTSLHNTGSMSAERISFSDYYPAGVDAYGALGCQTDRNNITWSGRLDVNEKHECMYILKGLRNSSISLYTAISYHNGTEAFSDETTTPITVLPYSIRISASHVGNTTSLGDEIPVNITIIALKDIQIHYLNINIPPGIRITKSDNALIRKGNLLAYKGMMKAGEEITFQQRLLPEMAGEETIRADSRFQVSEFIQETSFSLPLNVTFTGPNVRYGKTRFKNTSDALPIFLENPSTSAFYDVNLILTGFANSNYSVDKLEGLSHKEYLYNFDYPEGRYNISARITYLTVYGQKFFDFENNEIIINASVEHLEAVYNNSGNISGSENPIRIDVDRGFAQAKTLLLVLAGSIAVIAFFWIMAARMKKK
ncbi:hypothetical protein HYY72_05060 [Candidatus Woesearchaeota archaeon]|nr:hypothetical protein [Candidatus Woesearchaeota archaeon]